MNTTATPESCTDACNSLLRGELSAIETYQQALEKFRGDTAEGALQQILAEHGENARLIREHILSMDGGEPATDSGAWGAFAKAVEGTAKLFGESAALKALQEGEEHGINEYEDALESDDVMEEMKDLIRARFIPVLTRHIRQLEALRA